MKKIPNTENIKRLYENWLVLHLNLEKVLNQGFFQRKVTMHEKLEYLRAMSSANAEYWIAVYKEYPETMEGTVSGDSTHITIK